MRSSTRIRRARSTASTASGVKVGVLSDGIKGVFAEGLHERAARRRRARSRRGDLPDATGVRTAAGVLTSSTGGILGKSFQANSDLEGLPSGLCAFAGAGAEGTALLEIVHDLAPGAELSFANADTDVAFNQAVNFLAASNDVVVDDLGFFGEASDGTSPVSSNTAAALNNGANPDPRLRHRRTATRPTSTTTAPTPTRASDGTSAERHRRRPATCICFSRAATRPTCWTSGRSRTT